MGLVLLVSAVGARALLSPAWQLLEAEFSLPGLLKEEFEGFSSP